ncbi:MAG: TIGR03618 family F420-dependent PPOX class oxidoreductase [Nitriliruptoraceae bacterium]
MLTTAAIDLITSGVHGHVVTLDPDGRPHVTLAWCDVDDGDLVFATLFDQRKLRNLRADPRIAISFEARDAHGALLTPYLVVRGTATIEPGGAPELLRRLDPRYLEEDIDFPPLPDPPPGYITRVVIDEVAGTGTAVG